jgi:DnaJ-class molecular chaperone
MKDHLTSASTKTAPGRVNTPTHDELCGEFPLDADDSLCPECEGDGGDKWNDYCTECPTCGGAGRLW